MTIHIPIAELTSEIKTAYIEGRISHMSIDFAPNALLGRLDSKEVIVFDFSKFLWLDNRYSSYTIYTGTTELVIELSD